jgi:hypothetical protein
VAEEEESLRALPEGVISLRPVAEEKTDSLRPIAEENESLRLVAEERKGSLRLVAEEKVISLRPVAEEKESLRLIAEGWLRRSTWRRLRGLSLEWLNSLRNASLESESSPSTATKTIVLPASNAA